MLLKAARLRCLMFLVEQSVTGSGRFLASVEHAISLGFPTSVSTKHDITHLMGSCFYEHVFVFHAKTFQRLIVRGSPFLGHI